MEIEASLRQKILILDGAMGTKIQLLGLTAEGYHRGLFEGWPVSLVGNNDVLCLTAPDVIRSIHEQYIEAGADIITTNTFSANRISQKEYGCEEQAREMALAGARIARQSADTFKHQNSNNERQIFVAGSMGPTSKSLSLASDMNEPGSRTTTFDEMVAAYEEQAEALIEGGVDLLLLETCFDALNAKAAIYAIERINERRDMSMPLMVSATINDRSGRTLTGQTLEAFYISISHYPNLLSFGMNCSFGVTDLRPFVEQLSNRIPVFLSLYPNAGLPNEMGEYDELPAFTASHLRQMAEDGLLNIAGGCCGTTEEHIRAISEALQGLKPRQLPERDQRMWLAGLEPLLVDKKTQNFTNVGERTNVAGSRKFARLIAEKKYDEALSVARNQIEGGAQIIDINMDDAMLDSQQEMQTFCRYIANDPAVSRAVLMIDSSDWATVLAGLKNAQGKCIVNSISLKNDEADFVNKAQELRRLGAAVVVMAFDEDGQATTYERKIAIAERAYKLLTSIGFPAQDIIFDVNILSVGTGLKEHQSYGVDFIRAVGWIKQNLPLAKTSGGVSNLSFSFRGNNKVREAMHSVFLYHAIHEGLDMAIVNPGMLQVYDDIEPTLLKAVEDVILNTDDDATERLISMAAAVLADSATVLSGSDSGESDSWRNKTIEERLTYALSKGDNSHLADDIPEALQKYGRPIDVIEQPLMQAMEHIGQLFGEGKMFLPQVVKSAKVMKDAVAILQPYIDEEQGTQKTERPCVVLATANGDVHDIGKNIVGIVLGCNGFDVVDLGVMVPNETILEETRKRKPCLVGISGLITPSLKEMEQLCQLFQKEGLQIPIVVGGATTSTVHTAVKLAPLYDGCVVHGGDASQTSLLAKHLQMDAETTIVQIKAEQQTLRDAYEEHHAPLTPYAEANSKAPILNNYEWQETNELSDYYGNIPITDLTTLIDWRMFLLFWGFKGETLQQLLVNPEAERTLKEGQKYLQRAIEQDSIEVKALLHYVPAKRRGNDIVLAAHSVLAGYASEKYGNTVLPMLRSQSATGHYLCLSDYFDEQASTPLGLFTIVARPKQQPADEGDRLMSHAICARLAEACAEHLQHLSTISSQFSLLRVAFGYATSPDHSLKRIVFDLLEVEDKLNVTLTDHYSIQPSTSICGIFICHPDAHYFPVGRIDEDQLADYCQRRSISVAEGEQLLSKYIVKQSSK